MTAAAHRGVLLGDGDQLEPDPLDLKGAGQHLGREARDVGRAVQDSLQLGIVPTGTSSRAWNRMSSATSDEVPVMTGGAKPVTEAEGLA